MRQIATDVWRIQMWKRKYQNGIFYALLFVVGGKQLCPSFSICLSLHIYVCVCLCANTERHTTTHSHSHIYSQFRIMKQACFWTAWEIRVPGIVSGQPSVMERQLLFPMLGGHPNKAKGRNMTPNYC